jgi:hypothetical protein
MTYTLLDEARHELPVKKETSTQIGEREENSWELNSLVELRPEKIVDELTWGLVLLARGLILKNKICVRMESQGQPIRFVVATQKMQRTVVPAPLHGKGAGRRRVDARRGAQRRGKIEQWVRGRYSRLALGFGHGSFCFLGAGFFGRTLALYLLELPK